MQQMNPQEGRLFPEQPQQQAAHRFPSNAPQPPVQSYEPQPRMQNTGSYQPLQQSAYTTAQLQALHGTVPPHLLSQLPPTVVQGTPLLVYTDKGVPVAVTDQEMKRALAAQGELQEQEQEAGQKKKRRQKKELHGKKEQTGRFVMKFSVTWLVFGVIGIIATALTVYEWVVVPLLVWLYQLIGGGV